jgi:hypothetical protein
MPAVIGRRELIAAVTGAAVWPFSARAQVGERKYTIGIFSAGSGAGHLGKLTFPEGSAGIGDGWKGRTSFSSIASRRISLKSCPNSLPIWSDTRSTLSRQPELSHH